MAVTISSGNRYDAASVPVTAYPFTLACWANMTSNLANRTILCMSDGGGNNMSIRMTSAGAVTATASTSAGGNSSTTTATAGANEWFHAAGVFNSAAVRTAYLNANAGSVPTASRPFESGYNLTQFGFRPVVNEPFVGRVAEAAIWNVALTAAEIASLATGIRPSRVRPANLVLYMPLIRDAVDVARGRAFGAVGSPGIADHPRRIG